MKKQTKGYFLPMTQEAVDSIARHTDIHMAKPIFALLQHRQKHGLKEADVILRFPELVDEERNYRYNLNRMRWEIEQLFNITPPVVQAGIREQLLTTVRVLEGLIKRKRVIKELLDSNQFEYTHFPNTKGKLETIKVARKKSEQMDAKLLTTPLFDEYLLLLRSMVDYFKVAVEPLVNHSPLPDLDDYDVPDDLGLYADDDIRKYITDWPAFIKICDYYSEPLSYEWVKRNAPGKLTDYRLIIKLDGQENYEWRGIESAPIPSLTDFFKMLATKQIFKLGIKEKQGKAIFKFFHITGKVDPGFVLDDLFAAKRKPIYDVCFDREIGL